MHIFTNRPVTVKFPAKKRKEKKKEPPLKSRNKIVKSIAGVLCSFHWMLRLHVDTLTNQIMLNILSIVLFLKKIRCIESDRSESDYWFVQFSIAIVFWNIWMSVT